MAQETIKTVNATAKDGMVRFTIGDEGADITPRQANEVAASLVRSAHEAVYGNRPKTLTITFNFED